MAAFDLSDSVRYFLPHSPYVRRIKQLEERLASIGFSQTGGDDRTVSSFDEVYKEILIRTDARNGVGLGITATLNGIIQLPHGLSKKANLNVNSFDNIRVGVSYNSYHLADLWIGQVFPSTLNVPVPPFYSKKLLRSFFRLFPENPKIIPGYGVYKGEPLDSETAHVWDWVVNHRTHTLEELTSLPHVEPNMLALHKLAGPDFRYAVRLVYDEPPAEHGLFLDDVNKLNAKQIFDLSVDALCSIVKDYKPQPVEKLVIA